MSKHTLFYDTGTVIKIDDDPLALLLAAIIDRAVEDYKTALRSENPGARKELERFFLSDWGEAITRYNGRLVIDRVRREMGMPPIEN